MLQVPLLKKNINKTIELTLDERKQVKPMGYGMQTQKFTVFKQFNTSRSCTLCRGTRIVVYYDSDSGSMKKAYCPACLGNGELYFTGNEKQFEVRPC